MTLLPPTTWADHWQTLVAGRDGQRGVDQRDGDPARDPWSARADRFAAYSAGLPDDDPLFGRLRAAVRPTDTVLDVGAGAGRYAVPLAALTRAVVAIEPSPAMRRHLADRIAAAGAGNVALVGAPWPTADAPVADVTLCSHVVYGVRQIAPFLRALDAHTRRLCLLAIRVDQHPGIAELSRALFGENRVRQPALLDLYGALLDLGIAADVQIIPASGGFRFADHAEAAAHYRDRLRIPPGTPTEAHLHDLIADHLTQEPDGRWRWPSPPPRNAIVSWTQRSRHSRKTHPLTTIPPPPTAPPHPPSSGEGRRRSGGEGSPHQPDRPTCQKDRPRLRDAGR